MTVPATGAGGAVVTFNVAATDACSIPVAVTCTPAVRRTDLDPWRALSRLNLFCHLTDSKGFAETFTAKGSTAHELAAFMGLGEEQFGSDGIEWTGSAWQ